MKHSKLLLAAALSAAAFCTASQAQTIIYGVEYYNTPSTGTTPSGSNWTAYPSSPANIGYSVTEYRDSYGILHQRADPVVVESRGTTYAYPETARLGSSSGRVIYPSDTVIYNYPGVDVYMLSPGDARY